jgi:hypothetical protein
MIPKRNKTNNQAVPINLDTQIYSFNFKQEEPEEALIITVDHKKVCSLGGLVVLTGKPKARKTTFLHSFIGSALVKLPIFSIYTDLPKDKNKVVLIDTEQSNYDLYRSMARLSFSINIPINNLPDNNFSLYSTRSLDTKETVNLIDQILKDNADIGLLCIDSLLDLVTDINDVVEAKGIINKIKFWLDTYKIGIITVIHQSKSTNFSLGHLGSFASRFCQSELSIEKNTDNSSTLQATYLRSDENFNPVNIVYSELERSYKQTFNKKTDNIAEMDHRTIVDKLFQNRAVYTYKDLLTDLKQVYQDHSAYWIQNTLVPFLYQQNFIVKHKLGILKFR